MQILGKQLNIVMEIVRCGNICKLARSYLSNYKMSNCITFEAMQSISFLYNLKLERRHIKWCMLFVKA